MSLLFYESPIIGAASVASIGAALYSENKLLIGVSITIFILLLFFYRSFNDVIIASDDDVVSPCEGVVVKIENLGEYIYVAIFMSVINRHTQIYPANCRVISRVFDDTGRFHLVANLDKSKYNEKKIHNLMLDNGGFIQLTQIAGALPRAITSSDDLGSYFAGDYLGMIKFGSRIDLKISKKSMTGEFQLYINENDHVNIGKLIGVYVR